MSTQNMENWRLFNEEVKYSETCSDYEKFLRNPFTQTLERISSHKNETREEIDC